MKAFSLWQPWASLWCSQRKRHETRDSASNFSRTYRGWLAVQATKKMVHKVEPELDEILFYEFGSNWRKELPTGAIIGVVNVVNVVPTHKVFPPDIRFAEGNDTERDDFLCGNFDFGRLAIERREFALLAEPIPCKGQQGRYFDVPDYPQLTALMRKAA